MSLFYLVSIENHADDANSSSDEGNEVDSHVAIQKSDDIALALGPELDAFFADDQFDSQLFSTENLNDEAQDWTLPSVSKPVIFAQIFEFNSISVRLVSYSKVPDKKNAFKKLEPKNFEAWKIHYQKYTTLGNDIQRNRPCTHLKIFRNGISRLHMPIKHSENKTITQSGLFENGIRPGYLESSIQQT